MKTLSEKIDCLFREQLEEWPLATANYKALDCIEVKQIELKGMNVKVQYNPARAVSSGAKTDAASIKARKCFLCDENRPAEQHGIPWHRHYTILVNPYPIFRRHLTIPDMRHTAQRIDGRIADMMALAEELKGYVVFYNGPRCGASAPDHMHFQAGEADLLTLADAIAETRLTPVVEDNGAKLRLADKLPFRFFIIDSSTPDEGASMFSRLYRSLPKAEDEPMMNILCFGTADGIRTLVIPRKRHRPSFYGTDGDGAMLISPASVDLGGVIITPRACDFEKIDKDIISNLFNEVCLSDCETNTIISKINDMEKEPDINVGILSADQIQVTLLKEYNHAATSSAARGPQTFSVTPEGKVAWQGLAHNSVMLTPGEADASFEVHDVTIGVNFHWERRETQRFRGALKIIVENGHLTLINILPAEEYLKSVISSEMSATASPEFLKAHAVISRSWLLAQLAKNKRIAVNNEKYSASTVTDSEIIRWYDREDHVNFDVCADDHCQRYQGITRQTTKTVSEAVDATRGLVLTDKDGELCDARFSKCCGGVFEQFETCWEPKHYHYLEARRDSAEENDFPDLTVEKNACRWILSSPEAYCNTDDKEILGQVLNNYDQETADFYRWSVEYTQAELSQLIKERSGIDFGKIIALEPVERGTSGRLLRLRIVGTQRTMVIGKELEIRRTLSTSHLYSSAFVVETGTADSEGIPSYFKLIGAGWGHGVGLCQIGAAVMGAHGCDFREILFHYFIGASLSKLY